MSEKFHSFGFLGCFVLVKKKKRKEERREREKEGEGRKKEERERKRSSNVETLRVETWIITLSILLMSLRS